jgi:hypothetical protein
MKVQVQSLGELFDQQRTLHAEQLRISQDLALVNQKIHYLLALHASRASGSKDLPALESRPAQGAKGNGKLRPSKRHSWFERGEAVKLISRIARRPMRPAQVVGAAMDAKGYSALAGGDKKRAQSALHQAVIAAVKAGALTRRADGAVQAAA